MAQTQFWMRNLCLNKLNDLVADVAQTVGG